MESEPASHYQLSLDENDELLVDQGMFELDQEIEEYDSEPRQFRASSYADVHEPSQKSVELEAAHSSSPVVLDPINNIDPSPVRTHSLMQSESRDADLELESSNESMKNSEKAQADSKEDVDENNTEVSETNNNEEIIDHEAKEQESAEMSSGNDSQANSREDIKSTNSEKSSDSKSGGATSDKTSIHSDSQSVEDAVKDDGEENESNIEEIETVPQHDTVVVMESPSIVENETRSMEANDQSGEVKDSDKEDSSDEKIDEEKLSVDEKVVEEIEMESSSDSQSLFQEDMTEKKESDEEENKIVSQPKNEEEKQFVRDNNSESQSSGLQSSGSQSSGSNQESQRKDGDNEQTDSSNSDTKVSSDVSKKSNPDTKQDKLVETSSLPKVSDLKELFQKIGNSPSSSPASNTKYKPLTYQKQNVLQSGFDTSGSESSLDDSPNDNPPTQQHPEEHLTADRPKFNLSGNEQTKQNNQGVSSLATVAYKAPLPNLSTSDNESESEVNLATTEVQTVEPKLAIHVVAGSREVNNNTGPPGVQTQQQPIRKRKHTPAIMDPMAMQQQLLQQFSVGNTKTGDLSLGSIAEGIIEEEEEGESDDEGNTRFWGWCV